MALPSIEEAKQLALEFCQPPRFAQMITLAANGELRGRTLGGALRPDYSVEIVSFNSFARAGQVRRNPQMMMIWNDGKPGGERSPSSGGESGGIPRVVFAIGTGEVLDGQRFLDWYAQRIEKSGPIRGLSPDDAVKQMSVIIFKANQLRLEGFAAPGTSLDFAEVTTGLSFPV